MSIHIDALRDIAANHGWGVCDEVADELIELEGNLSRVAGLVVALQKIIASGHDKGGVAQGALTAYGFVGGHWSDCAVHNEPAYPAGECDCGQTAPVMASQP